MAEKIEGFYLDGTEYEFGGGGAEYNAGEGISIEDISINGRQGPAPEGFHVPSITEWQGLKTIMDGLSLTTGDNWRIKLHMPYAGCRDYSSADLKNQGSNGYYWSSSPRGSDYPSSARVLILDSSSVYANDSINHAYGLSVRCFKDSYETPTSSWTVVQGTLGSAGIFRNQTDGLISITSDGTTGYTIQDKNLGATTVYNNGNTLTQANMGNMYQWGNNYGFPSTGTISKTSSTLVDASNYGPSTANGYYESDTFIKGSLDWSSVYNDDLWGDTTGTITQKNVISNTGVFSVTAGTGIDITNDEIGLDGTYELIGNQGPAPSGFHVPTKDEWVALCGILTSTFGMASNATTMGTYLKMPMAGYRDFFNSNVSNVEGIGLYWSSTPGNASYACLLAFDTSIRPQTDSGRRAMGYSVRCFKNSPVVPTSSWTILYQGTGNAGIFWDNTYGLISISGDGQTWYTIQDKNLGATTVYNQGDTLTDANCGNFYQWGNNYGFPHSGTVTTSSTKVDASNYGPGNYYTSSTFITTSSVYGEWSSVQNDNLWGDTTGTVSGSLVVGDKLYKIVTSTTAPAAGTANNVITFVTD